MSDAEKNLDIYNAASRLPLSLRVSLAHRTIDDVLSPEVNERFGSALYNRSRLRASGVVLVMVSNEMRKVEQAERIQAQERNVQIHAIAKALDSDSVPHREHWRLSVATELYDKGVRVPGAAEVGE